MAASLLSQDIVAICLVIAEGNIEFSLEEIICRLEKFQDTNNRHFGISESDFRILFKNLIYSELELKTFCDEIGDIRLCDIIPDILNYSDAFFNDEGEYWIKENFRRKKKLDNQFIQYWFGYDEKEYDEKVILKQAMKEFFSTLDQASNAERVKIFLGNYGIANTILLKLSRPGKSS